MSVGIVSGPIYILLFVFALWLCGFTVAGVVGGSCAAATQSSIGLVPAQSIFASFQSMGALGLASFNPYVYVAWSFCNMVFAGLIMYYQACHLASSCPCQN